MTILGNFPTAQPTGVAINNVGQALVSIAYHGSGRSETWIWSDGQLNQIPSLGGPTLAGWAINDDGDVVGAATDSSGRSVSFLYKNGVTTPLTDLSGDLASTAFSINDTDQIVGCGIDPTNGPEALLWQNNQVVRLNDLIPSDSGWDLQSAVSIDDNGTIVGNGLFDGQPQAFLLTPTTSSSSSLPTPEPTTLPLLLTAALPLLRRHPHKSP